MIEILVENYGVLLGGAATTVVVPGLSSAIGMGLGRALAFGLLSERAPPGPGLAGRPGCG